MEIVAIFSVASVSKSISAYFNLIDSVSNDVQKLVHQSYKSAIMNLEYAKKLSSIDSQHDYLKQAKNEFIRAIAIEENENLISSYVGLAVCQHLLGEHLNANYTIEQIKNVNLTVSARTKALAGEAWNWFLGWNLREFHARGEYRIKEFDEYKIQSMKCMENYDANQNNCGSTGIR